MRTAWSPWMRISEWSAAKCGRIRSATARRGIFQATDWDRNGSTTGISRIGVMLVNDKCDFFIKTGKWDWLFLQSDIGISSAEMGIQPKKRQMARRCVTIPSIPFLHLRNPPSVGAGEFVPS